MIQNPELALQKIEQILKRFDSTEDQENYGAYAAAKTLINDLKAYAKSEELLPGYTGEKLGNLEWHTGAMFGFDEDNGHSSAQHQMWARQEIAVLREQTFLIKPLAKAC